MSQARARLAAFANLCILRWDSTQITDVVRFIKNVKKAGSADNVAFITTQNTMMRGNYTDGSLE